MGRLYHKKTDKITVIIVEDEPPMLRFLHRLLSDMDGFLVVGECLSAQEALNQAKGRLRSLVGTKAGLRLTPQLQFIFDEVPGEAHEIEDILAMARKRDEELAKARETAQYAGDADPYKHPEPRDEDADPDEDADWDDESEDDDWDVSEFYTKVNPGA